MKEALYYETLPDKKVKCNLCPNFCIIGDGHTGVCLNRKNIDGRLFSLNYGVVSSVNIDPIEKKPLYHFYPGKSIFSIGTFGCSFTCPFCQNYSISRVKASKEKYGEVTPEKIVSLAKNYSDMIAYTYNEPYIWYEFLLETCEISKKEGLKNVLVTNGYYNDEPWENLSKYIDAMNIDLKGDESFYKRLCNGAFEPVLKTIETAFNKGIHVEVTYLVVTGENDDPYTFSEVVRRLSSISKLIPLHISRYFPAYKFHAPATDPRKLEELYLIAKNEMEYVYLGNVLEHNDTVCPSCGKLNIERHGYNISIVDGFNGRCSCGYKFYGRFV